MKFTTTLAAALLCATPLFAQDEERLEAARAYVESDVQQKLMTDMLSPEMIMAQMGPALQQVPTEQLEIITNIVSEEVNRIRPAMEQAMIQGAATTFSLEEIEALTAFYSSPLGASAMSKMTPFMQSTMGTLQPELQAMQSQVMQRVQAELQQ
ncbi:DUF2059 domain-containing protein [Litoreibacter roseus]|uniref:DUF2059 domain-containing protein n=1 Tax=Litoreibacter roseus TaxID=2601869 RepID=A0A6N6JL55_9RHOB|nr:DUF2059 domain-containing protein [Litoreibacter roseus]GFE66008.1 hypothetical protein KIN_30820 [Litoreibacter roseus]